MHQEFSEMDNAVLATFGITVTITYPDDSSLSTNAIISKDQLPIGQFDAMMEETTVLVVSSNLQIKRGDRVAFEGQQWTVDRKLKDDGSLARWNLHED